MRRSLVRIEVDCERIRHNTESIVGLCAKYGIKVVGVTKSVCGNPDVARAMLAGGVSMVGESRLSHIRRLHEAGIKADIMMLRLPTLSEVDEIVRLTKVSLNSQVETIRALSRAAQAQNIIHRVILMIEAGDRREGVMSENAMPIAREILGLPNIELIGVGANVSCIGGVQPSWENTQIIVDVAEDIERRLGVPVQVISGGHTSSLFLLGRGEMPSRVNQLRIGEGILLGIDPGNEHPLPAPYHDAFNIIAEIIEIETKPSLPQGKVAVDSFGRVPELKDRGIRKRAILAMGEQDLLISGLTPKLPGVEVIGASSDHLVVDITEAVCPLRLGDELEFMPNYASISTGMAHRDISQVIKPMEG
jgi:predicted amino acid racemase